MKVFFTCLFVLFGLLANAQSHNMQNNSMCRYAPKPPFDMVSARPCAPCEKEKEKERAARKAEDIRVDAARVVAARQRKAAQAVAAAEAARAIAIKERQRLAKAAAEKAAIEKDKAKPREFGELPPIYVTTGN